MKKQKIKTHKHLSFTPEDFLALLLPSHFPSLLVLPLIIPKESPARGTYGMMGFFSFEDEHDPDPRVMSIGITDKDDEEVVLIDVGWEDEAFYRAKGYEPEEARYMRQGVLIDYNDDFPYAKDVFKYFQKMIQEDSAFMDYVKKQYQKFITIGSQKKVEKMIDEQMKKMNVLEKIASKILR